MTGTLCLSKAGRQPLLEMRKGNAHQLISLDGSIRDVTSLGDFERLRPIRRDQFLKSGVPCPLCGRTQGAHVGKVQQLFWSVDLVSCVCGLVRKADFPVASVFEAIYEAGYSNFRTTEAYRAQDVYAPRLRRLPAPRGRLLDVGCGSGGFVLAARAAGYEALGIDPFLPEETHTLPGFHKLDISDTTRGQIGTFDIVALWAVWEHLESPVKVLHSARRLLKPRGSIILNSPCGTSLHARLMPEKWYMATLLEHLHFLTKQAVAELAKKLELSVTRVRSSGVPYPLGRRGPGPPAQGLNDRTTAKIFSLPHHPDPATPNPPDSTGPAYSREWLGKGVAIGKTWARHPQVGRVLRVVLDQARLGDHLEVTLSSRS